MFGETQGVGELLGHHAGPAPGADMGEQHDHRVRFEGRLERRAGGREQLVDDPPVLHVRRQQAERHLADLGPGHAVTIAEGAVFRGEQAILLEIERHRAQPPQRLVVDVGQACIDFEVLDHRQDLDRGARQDRELHVGMLGAVRRGQRRDHGERRRNGGDLEMAVQALLQGAHFLAHGPRVGHDRTRPVEHPLSLGGEAQEARRALHQHDAQGLLELLDARGEGRLRDAAQFGGLAEILFARQRQEILELVDHPVTAPRSVAAARARAHRYAPPCWRGTRPASVPFSPAERSSARVRCWCGPATRGSRPAPARCGCA